MTPFLITMALCAAYGAAIDGLNTALISMVAGGAAALFTDWLGRKVEPYVQ